MSNISLSINQEVNHHAIDIIEKMGLTLNDAVCLFLEQINKQGELPFKVEIPNKETIKAMEETDLEPMTLDELSDLWDNIEKTS